MLMFLGLANELSAIRDRLADPQFNDLRNFFRVTPDHHPPQVQSQPQLLFLYPFSEIAGRELLDLFNTVLFTTSDTMPEKIAPEKIEATVERMSEFLRVLKYDFARLSIRPCSCYSATSKK
jgi:hypothetical protein